MNVEFRVFAAVAAALLAAPHLPANPHVAKGLTLELAADRPTVVPGQPILLGVVLRPDEGFHTYWRQPGLVGLTPAVTWSLPEGIEAEDMLWPEPQRGKMAAYGVWCLKRDVCLVTPLTVPATLDPALTPTVTLKASVVWMACSRTCHPGTAELTLTLPVQAQTAAAAPATATPATATSAAAASTAALIAQTLREQPVEEKEWTFSAVQHGPDGGFSLTITPPPGRHVPEDAYFYGHQRLVDSNVEPSRHDLPGGAMRIDLALVEEPDPVPERLVGELWSAQGWGEKQDSRLLVVRAPLTVAAKNQ